MGGRKRIRKLVGEKIKLPKVKKPKLLPERAYTMILVYDKFSRRRVLRRKFIKGTFLERQEKNVTEEIEEEFNDNQVEDKEDKNYFLLREKEKQDKTKTKT